MADELTQLCRNREGRQFPPSNVPERLNRTPGFTKLDRRFV